MPGLTTTIEPDEFLGLCAITDLEKMANGGEADVTSIAKALMHGALSARLEELGLPWAPSEADVQRRAAEVAQPAAGQPTAARGQRVRKYTVSILMAVTALLLWGGYIRGWQWTGFQANEQLWDWLQLLLLPLVVPTILLPAAGRWFTGNAAERAEAAAEPARPAPSSAKSLAGTR
jgi:hypothetical protein